MGMDPSFALRFVLYDMRLVNTFIIAIYGDMIMPNLVAFYAKLNENIKKNHFALEVSISI